MTCKWLRLTWWAVVAVTLTAALAGCQRNYIRPTEQLGFQQRDVFANGIEEARSSQEAARERFLSTLATFGKVVKFRDGELQRNFKQFSDELAETQSSAQAVLAQIESMEIVAQDVFDEWQSDLDGYQNDNLRRISGLKLEQARQDYAELLGTMRDVEEKMGPIIVTFHDQVVFLKHNLNHEAIAALENELVAIQAQTAALIEAMDVSIAEADSFVNAMDWA